MRQRSLAVAARQLTRKAETPSEPRARASEWSATRGASSDAHRPNRGPAASLVPQRVDRIHIRRAPRRDHAGQRRRHR